MKKIICYIMVLSIVLGFAGCGAKETVKPETAEVQKEVEMIEIKDDEIITTYAYRNLDGVDVSSLGEVVINAEEITKGDETTGDIFEYKAAFFGEVKNVKINYSGYTYEYRGEEIGSYDSLKDTLLIIKSNKLDDYAGFFVWFEDGRGIENRFIVGDGIVGEGNKIELKSGFTALEKTPSPYTAYDMSDVVNCIGMTTDEFDSSAMMQYAEKEMVDGMDDQFYSYNMNDFIKGLKIEYNASKTDNTITTCYIRTDQETYENLSDEEKYSFLGMDFDMSVVRAKYNMVKPDLLTGSDVWGQTPDSAIDTIVLYK